MSGVPIRADGTRTRRREEKHPELTGWVGAPTLIAVVAISILLGIAITMAMLAIF